jgi:hypothetical protein
LSSYVPRTPSGYPPSVPTTGRSDLVEGALDVVLEGRAEQVTDDAELEPVATAFAVKFSQTTWRCFP